jgi:hypothetical protein
MSCSILSCSLRRSSIYTYYFISSYSYLTAASIARFPLNIFSYILLSLRNTRPASLFSLCFPASFTSN